MYTTKLVTSFGYNCVFFSSFLQNMYETLLVLSWTFKITFLIIYENKTKRKTRKYKVVNGDQANEEEPYIP